MTSLYKCHTAIFLSVPLGKESNFDKFDHGEIQDLGETYDYGSVMHYGSKSFSRNGRPTIVGLKTGADQMGQRKGFSANDIRQINKLYKCPNSKLDCKSEVRRVCCRKQSFTTISQLYLYLYELTAQACNLSNSDKSSRSFALKIVFYYFTLNFDTILKMNTHGLFNGNHLIAQIPKH